MSAKAPHRLRRDPHTRLQRVGSSAVLVKAGDLDVRVINDVGAWLWEHCEGRGEDELVSRLADAYDVDAERAREDVRALVEMLRTEGLLTVCEERPER